MAPPNPNPSRISDAIWRLWNDFDAHEPPALLGGIYAAKPGYHNYRNAIAANGDYSVRLAADKRGSGTKACALDISMPEAQMRKYTARLDAAARARDPRLYTSAGPVLREFIGTKDGDTVYCYVLVGGVALGVPTDAGPDPGRDKTHLWHIHLSIIRQFCEDWGALSGVLSVLIGQPLADWQGGGDMATLNQIWKLLHDGSRGDGLAQTSNGGIPIAWIVRMFYEMRAEFRALGAAVASVDEEVAAKLQADLDELQAKVDTEMAEIDAAMAEAQTAIEATPSQVIAQLTAVGTDQGSTALIAALGEVEAREFAKAVLAKTGE